MMEKVIGQNIKKLRKQKGYNQQEFGDLIGLTRTSVMNIESGRHSPTLERFFTICCLLEVTPNDIFPPTKKIKVKEYKKKIVVTKIKRYFKPVTP